MPDGTHGADDRKDDENSDDLTCGVNSVADKDISREGVQVKPLRKPSRFVF